MNRIALCIAIMLVIAAASLGTLFLLEHSTDKVCTLVEQVIDAEKSGSPEQVEQAVTELEDYWQLHLKRLYCLVQSSVLNDISCAVARLRPLYEQGADDFIAECCGIRRLVSQIMDTQAPSLYSVL